MIGDKLPLIDILYLQICKHVCQAKFTEVILIENLQIFASVFCTIFIFKRGAGPEHYLDSGQFEMDV